MEWGALPLAEFEQRVKIELTRRYVLLLKRLKFVLSCMVENRIMADDVNFCIKALRRAIDVQDIVALDLPKWVASEDASKYMQSVVRKLGELVQVWPDLCNASRELHNRGVLLCKPI